MCIRDSQLQWQQEQNAREQSAREKQLMDQTKEAEAKAEQERKRVQDHEQRVQVAALAAVEEERKRYDRLLAAQGTQLGEMQEKLLREARASAESAAREVSEAKAAETLKTALNARLSESLTKQQAEMQQEKLRLEAEAHRLTNVCGQQQDAINAFTVRLQSAESERANAESKADSARQELTRVWDKADGLTTQLSAANGRAEAQMENFFRSAPMWDIQQVLQSRGILCMAAPTPQGQPVHTATMTMTQTAPVQTTTNQSGVQPMFAAQQDGNAGTHGNSGSSQGGGGGGQRPTGNLQPPVVETEASRSKALQQNGQNNVDPSGQTAPTMDNGQNGNNGGLQPCAGGFPTQVAQSSTTMDGTASHNPFLFGQLAPPSPPGLTLPSGAGPVSYTQIRANETLG